MLLIKRFLKHLEKYSENKVYNTNYSKLYIEVNKLYNFLKNNNIKAVNIEKLTLYNKLICIILSILFDIDLYYYENDDNYLSKMSN